MFFRQAVYKTSLSGDLRLVGYFIYLYKQVANLPYV